MRPGSVDGATIRRVARAFGIDLKEPTDKDREKICRILALQWDEVLALLTRDQPPDAS